MVPCGTPDKTLASVDLVPSTKQTVSFGSKMIRFSVEWNLERHSSSTCVAGDDEALCRMPWQNREE